MGVRAAIVVSVTSFLLGALFTHWIADSLTLWQSPVTDEHLWISAVYYSILAKQPWQFLAFLGTVVTAGAATILWSFNDLRAGNIMFDGGSIFLFGTTVVMYANSVLPSIFAQFASLPPHQLRDPIPRALRNATLELASNNLICSVALTGILALQAGRFWAESADSDDEDDQFVMVDPQPADADETVGKARTTGAKTSDISIRDEKVKPLLQQRVQTS